MTHPVYRQVLPVCVEVNNSTITHRLQLFALCPIGTVSDREISLCPIRNVRNRDSLTMSMLRRFNSETVYTMIVDDDIMVLDTFPTE